MTLSRNGLAIPVPALWAGAWVLWMLTGAALPVPPWSAAERLDAEERAASALVADPARTPAWAAVAGGLQPQAFGVGWSAVERGGGRSFVRADLPRATLVFVSADWPSATLRIRSGPTETVGTDPVAVVLDARERGRLAWNGAWAVEALDLGALASGRHQLELQGSFPGFTLAAVAVGAPESDVLDRDAGFVQWLPVGADERPVFFPAAEGATPKGVSILWRGRRGDYAFAAPPAGRASALLEITHGLSAGALLALLSGLPIASRLAQTAAARATLALALSAGGLLVVFLALRLFAVPPGVGPVAAGLLAFGAAGVFAARRERVFVPWRALLPGVLVLPVLVHFALRVVPPLVDQDVEPRATAHALATRQVPATVTDRGTTHFFAHPPLLHLFTSGSFALSGRLSRVADAERLASAGQAREASRQPEYGAYPPRYYDLWWDLLERFHREPQLWPTRALNVLLAAATLAWLAELAARTSGSTLTGWLLAAVLGSFPEFLVRGAYGGYFSLTVFTSLGVLAALGERRDGASGLASALAAITDQKGLLAPAAWLLAAPRGSGRARLVPAAAAAAALVLFAAWGLLIDAPAFVHDFLREHVARRLSLSDVRLTHDPNVWYPSIPELWAEFASRYGLVFTLAAAAASLAALRSKLPLVRAAGAAVLLGALVFSLTDWRQTKHLALLAAPALLALAGLAPRGRRARWAFALLLFAMIATNLAASLSLAADFDALRPSTIW